MASARLPQLLKPFFWDYPFDKLSWRADHDLIIRRVLTNGSWDAILWLRKKVDDDTLRVWLLEHEGRGLSPRQIRFWELMVDLPRRKANQWIRREKENPWWGRMNRTFNQAEKVKKKEGKQGELGI